MNVKHLATAFVITVITNGCKEGSATTTVEPDKEAKKIQNTSSPSSTALTEGAPSSSASAAPSGGPSVDAPRKNVARVIKKDAGDGCLYVYHVQCSPDASCNPPEPISVDCPPDLGGKPSAHAKPKDKEDWLRIAEKLDASTYGCVFRSDGFCRPPPGEQTCETGIETKVNCKVVGQTPGGKKIALEAFEAKDHLGKCRSFEATQCIDGNECALPKSKEIACK